VVTVRLDLGQVVLAGHAAIHDHCAAALSATALFEDTQHVLKRSAILTIAFETS
jgi:hypothetical protein